MEDQHQIDSNEYLDSHIHYLLHWEKNQPNTVHFVQPLANGEVISYTWADVGQQVRSMANYLLSLNLPKHSHIAIFGKNSAHWIMADLAIWMHRQVLFRRPWYLKKYICIPLWDCL